MMNPKRYVKQPSTLKGERFFGKDITNIENKERCNPKNHSRPSFELEKSLIANKTKKYPLRNQERSKKPSRYQRRADIPTYLAQQSIRSFERSKSRQRSYNLPKPKKRSNIAEKIKQQLSSIYGKKHTTKQLNKSARDRSITRPQVRSISRPRERGKSTKFGSKSARSLFGSPDPLSRHHKKRDIRRNIEIPKLLVKASHPGSQLEKNKELFVPYIWNQLLDSQVSKSPLTSG